VAPEEPQAFGCPSCGGQFGVTQDMNGQRVACPHCDAPTLIQLNVPASSVQPTAVPVDPEPVDDGPLIKTNLPVSRKKKKKLRRIAKSRGPARIDQDLFAPEDNRGEAAPAAPPASVPSPPIATPPTPATAAPNTPVAAEPTTTPPAASSSAPPSQIAPNPRPQSAPKPESASLPPLVPKLRPAAPATKTQLEAKSATTQSAHQEAQNVTTTESSRFSDLREADTKQAKRIGAPEQDSMSIAHLLPPKFNVLDPAKMGNEKFKIVLPDGQGGMAQMDNRVLRVKHAGKQVSLVTMTPEQRAKKRLIQNIVAILLGVAIMAIAFTILM